MNLGGEYEFPEVANGETLHSVQTARTHFIWEVEKSVPQVKQSLKGDLLEPYQRLAPDAVYPGIDLNALRADSQPDFNGIRFAALGESPPVTEYARHLEAKAHEWGLNVAWFLDWALRQMETELQYQRPSTVNPDGTKTHYAKGYSIDLSIRTISSVDERRLNISLTAMDFALHTKKQVREHLRHHCHKAIEIHLDNMERMAKERGFVRAPKLNKTLGSPLTHFNWLVRYQVLRQSWAEIAEAVAAADLRGRVDRSEDAIKKAVRAKADLIGLPLREE